MMHTAFFGVLCGFLLIFLSVRVIRLRHMLGISVGHGGAAELERAMRVQANFSEYTPLFLILLAFAEAQGLAPWAVHGIGFGFIGGRILHFVGFRAPESPGLPRVLGMALTFTAIGLLSGLLATWFVLAASL